MVETKHQMAVQVCTCLMRFYFYCSLFGGCSSSVVCATSRCRFETMLHQGQDSVFCRGTGIEPLTFLSANNVPTHWLQWGQRLQVVKYYFDELKACHSDAWCVPRLSQMCCHVLNEKKNPLWKHLCHNDDDRLVYIFLYSPVTVSHPDQWK